MIFTAACALADFSCDGRPEVHRERNQITMAESCLCCLFSILLLVLLWQLLLAPNA